MGTIYQRHIPFRQNQVSGTHLLDTDCWQKNWHNVCSDWKKDEIKITWRRNERGANDDNCKCFSPSNVDHLQWLQPFPRATAHAHTHTHMQKKTASLSFPSAPLPMVLAIPCDRAAQIRRISCPCHRMCPWGNLLCFSDKATTRWMGNIRRSIVSRCDHNLQCHEPDDTRKSPWTSSFCELVCFWSGWLPGFIQSSSRGKGLARKHCYAYAWPWPVHDHLVALPQCRKRSIDARPMRWNLNGSKLQAPHTNGKNLKSQVKCQRHIHIKLKQTLNKPIEYNA